MFLAEYFKNLEGTGIFATADKDGMVDLAIYAKPHVVDDRTIALVMRQKLSHQNLKSNIHAAYMFIEAGEGYRGLRLYLTKLREEINESVIAEFIKGNPNIAPLKDDSVKYLVFFRVDNTWPLVGDPQLEISE